MNDKWRNKDIVFYSYIVIWSIIILLTGDKFKDAPYYFIFTGILLVVLRATVLKRWWDKEVKL